MGTLFENMAKMWGLCLRMRPKCGDFVSEYVQNVGTLFENMAKMWGLCLSILPKCGDFV